MSKLIILLLVFFSNAHATEFVNEVSLYVFGDVSYTEYLLNSTAMIFASEAFSDMSIVATALFLAFTGWQITQNQSLEMVYNDAFKYAALAMLVLNTNMTMTVKIFDKRADYGMINYTDFNGNAIPSFAAVDSVPWFIGFPAGVASYISTSLIIVVDTAFSPIADQTYEKVGFLGTTRSLLNMIKHANLGYDSEMQEFDNKMTAYIRECILTHVAPADPSTVLKLKNPESTDLISQASPTVMGVPSDATLVYGSLGEQTCANFYNTQIAAKASTISAKLMKKLGELERPLNTENLHTAYSDLANIKTTSNVLSGVSNLEGFMMNVASNAPLKKAIASYQTGLTISAVDDVNTIASSNATLGIQQAGAGMFEWFAQRLPEALHFFKGLVYAFGVFPLLLAMTFRNFIFIMNLAKVIFSLELLNVSFALVHNAVTYYAQNDAFNKLAFLANSTNAGSTENLPIYLEHLSTMTGIAGFFGVVAAFYLPKAILSGDASSIVGAISGLGNKFNNSLAAVGSTLDQQLSNDKLNDELRREGKDSVSSGEMIQKQRIKAGMEKASQAHAALIANQNSSAYLHGSTAMADNQVGNTLGVGDSGVTTSEATRAGELMGASTGGTMKGLANSRLTSSASRDSGILQGMSQGETMSENAAMMNSPGFQNYLKGVSGDTAKRLGQTAGVGNQMNKLGKDTAAMRELGSYGGAEALATEVGAMDGKKRAGQFNSDGTASDSFMHGVESQSAKKSASTMEYGNRVSTATAIKAGISEGASGAGADIGSGRALNKYGSDKLSKASEASNFAKIGSGVESVESVGQGRFEQNQITKSVADTGSLNSSISTAGGRDGYVNLQENSASVSTQNQMGSTRSELMMASNKEGQQHLVNDVLSKAKERGEEQYNRTKNDLLASGLIDENANVKEGAWIESRSFLSKLNMAGQHGISAGGMSVSGSLSATSEGRASMDTSTSDASGHSKKIATTGEYDSWVSTYRAGHGGKDPSPEEIQEFIRTSEQTMHTKNNALGMTAATIADATGINSELAALGIGGAAGGIGMNSMFGNPAGKLRRAGENLSPFSREKESPQKASHTHNSQSSQSSKNIEHGNSFLSDMQNYTAEYMESKGLLNHETTNLEHLQTQRDSLSLDDPRGASLDQKISQSRSRLDGYQADVTRAEAGYKKARNGSMEFHPSAPSSHNPKTGLRIGGGALAVAGIADAIATGNAGQIVDSVKESFGGLNTTNNNAFAEDVEALIMGREDAKKAVTQMNNGEYFSGFATVAKGMTKQAIEGMAQVGQMAVSGAESIATNKTYAQARQDNHFEVFSVDQANMDKLKQGVDMDSLFKEQGPTPEVLMREHEGILKENSMQINEMLEGQTALEKQIEKLKRKK